MAVVLSGFGAVGREYVNLVRSQPSQVEVSVIRGQDSQALLEAGRPVPKRSQWAPVTPLYELLGETGAAVLVQAIPSSPKASVVAANEALTALRMGIDVVTATKGHLLSHWSELQSAAHGSGARIRMSAATGAALPAADMARVGLRGFECTSIRACPTGTATYVLDRLAEGDSIDSAIAGAQARGIAEADPSFDLSGADSATKIRLIAGILWGWDVSQIRVHLEGIDASTAPRIQMARARGMRMRAVASARRDAPLLVDVRLEALAPSDPLNQLCGPDKGVTFTCLDAGDITISGGRSSPLGAARALWKDTLGLGPGGDAVRR